MTFPTIVLPSLPPNTIVPEDEDQFVYYLNRLYEDIAYTVNNKDNDYFVIPVTDTPTNIPNVPNFGSFILLVSGQGVYSDGSYLPCLNASCCKASATVAGSIVVLGSQAGQGGGVWGSATLTITSTGTNFQINHSVSSVTGNFNIRIVGTQG